MALTFPKEQENYKNELLYPFKFS